jgi:hypothetical protein
VEKVPRHYRNPEDSGSFLMEARQPDTEAVPYPLPSR